jgi:uncharacterized membrane protein
VIRSWLAASAATAALDLLWLGVLARSLYARHLGHLMAPEAYWPAALAFYALYGAGVVFFTKAASAKESAFRGGALGLLVYGTYDLTNMAVLRDWGGAISAVDVCWGVFLTSVAGAAAFAAREK